MYVRNIMVKQPVTVIPERTIADAAKLMRECNVGCLVVTHGGRPIGMITDRDVVVRCTCEGHDSDECSVQSHMSKPVITVRPSTDVLEAAHVMTERQVKRLPVVEARKLVGLLSLSDIAQAMEQPMHDLLLGMGAARRVA
jgi:CBS domain-containing protein